MRAAIATSSSSDTSGVAVRDGVIGPAAFNGKGCFAFKVTKTGLLKEVSKLHKAVLAAGRKTDGLQAFNARDVGRGRAHHALPHVLP